jgi:hypothetical protein
MRTKASEEPRSVQLAGDWRGDGLH